MNRKGRHEALGKVAHKREGYPIWSDFSRNGSDDLIVWTGNLNASSIATRTCSETHRKTGLVRELHRLMSSFDAAR